MNEDKQDTGYVPPWVGPCGYCEKHIREKDDFVGFELEEFTKGKRRTLLCATLCSERCFENVISRGGNHFGRKLKTYYRDKNAKPRHKLSDDPAFKAIFGEWYCCCSYCGKSIDEDDYRLELSADGRIRSEDVYMFINSFCSKDCFRKALNLTRKYIEFAVGAYSPEDSILRQLEREEKHG